MFIKFFRKCGISVPVLALALALSSLSGCIDMGVISQQASSSHVDDVRTQAEVWVEPGISLDLSFESEIDRSLFRTWGKAILWSKRPLPYLLLNATLLQDGSAIGQSRYLLMNVEPLKDYSFEISRIEKADLIGSSYSCLLEAIGPDGIIASETRQCRLKYCPPDPSRSSSGLVRTPEEEWPDYEPPSEDTEQSGSEVSGDVEQGDDSGEGEIQNEQATEIPEPDRGGKEGERYVGSKSSKKYHAADCRYVLKLATKNKITFKSIEDAESQGYEPCKVCNPAG